MPKNIIIKPARRGRPLTLLVTTGIALLFASSPVSVPALSQWQHENKVNNPEYIKEYGRWDVIDLPEEFKLNAVHAAMLPTGKVLLIAGSGNNRESFDKFNNEDVVEVLRTVVYDPTTNTAKTVTTPDDLFCAGHAFMQTGELLVAGGTSGYEVMKEEVKKPAGAMVIHNEDPDGTPREFKKGTTFVSKTTGKKYVSTQDVILNPAEKLDHGNGHAIVTHSSTKVFVEAVAEDPSFVSDKNEQFTIEGLSGTDVQNIYGQGGPMTLNKQDFRGDNISFKFDPFTEQYVRTGDLQESRWYPSLPVLTNGDVLAVSGLDNGGVITETTERFDPKTNEWTFGPNQPFPTYPALFRTQDPDVLFFSGSNSGYGPIDKGRDPGFWNIKDDTFKPVPGLTETDALETSASVSLPPKQGSNDGSQSQKVMVAGGGGIGESALVTDRTAIIDLADENPAFKSGPKLPEAVRYVNMTVTPWDEVFAAGGTTDYRAKGNSYSNKAYSFNPTTNKIRPMAEEVVMRGYHSGSLLLPDGRILFYGNDPLYGDKLNTTAGTFEQRLEIYTPPQVYAANRPVLKTDGKPQTIKRGEKLTFKTDDAAEIKTARLIPPSSSTHVTNTEQRSVAAIVTGVDGEISIAVPEDENVLPNGWYMLFVTNQNGTPNKAHMVNVVN